MFEDFVLFFQKYKSISSQLLQEDFENYFKIFQRVKTITEIGLEEERVKTTSYNIFNILKIEKYEDETHTPFICNLLNIRGSHCQRDLFYNRFLELIIPDDVDQRSKFLPNHPIFFKISTQKGIYVPDHGQGFIDIFIDYIEPGKKSFSIIIENKIYHGDGNHQMDKYMTYLESLYRDYKLLIYLTLTGKPPETHSMKPENVIRHKKNEKLKLVSYQYDISTMLTNSFEDIKSEKVKHTIIQYLSLIKTL